MPITYDIETDGLYLKGIEKGRERGLEESALAMLAAGFSAEQVAQWLSLPLPQVQALTDTSSNTQV